MSAIKESDITNGEQLHLELEKARRYREVTPNDVAYVWWLAGSGGAGFRLLRESHHTDADIQAAADHLCGSRDVVELWVASIPEASFDAHLAESLSVAKPNGQPPMRSSSCARIWRAPRRSVM